MDGPQALRRLTEAALEWELRRVEYRRLERSRPAVVDERYKKALDDALKRLVQASDKLELASRALRKALQALPRRPFPWAKVLKIASNVLGAAGNNLEPEEKPMGKIIDVRPG